MAQTKEPQANESALEELVFLARSRHRIALIRQLSGEAQSRQELESATGIPQPTLGRILNDFEARHWVSNEYNGEYSLTPVGSMLRTELKDLITVLNSSHRLTAIADSLPLDRLGFDLRHLATARVFEPSESDPFVHMRRFDKLAASGDNVQVFSNVLACAPGNNVADAHMEFLSDLDTIVVTADGLESGLDDPELRNWLRDRVESDELEVYRYDGQSPYLLGLFDDTVGLVPVDNSGVPSGLLEAVNPAIREWARQRFTDLQEQATEVKAGTLAP